MSNLFNSTGYILYSDSMVRGDGCYVYDKDGKEYIDLESGVWALPLGHCDHDINMAIHRQIDKIVHCGYKYNDFIAEKCAQLLTNIADFKNGKCVFLTSGSEAVEYGVQLARSIRPNKKCACLKGQYLSAYGICMQEFEQEWNLIEWDYHDNKSIEQYCDEISNEIDFSQIGVFVFEPGNSSGLVKLPPKNLVHAIELLANRNNVIIVVDEVTCGIGRTGKWFGYMHYDIQPHIIAVGKGMGNGYPVSAVIIEENTVIQAEMVKFHYAQSHQNDPLGCRVAYEVITKIKRENLLETSSAVATYFIEKYKELQKELPVISEVRGRGMLLCIELSDKVSCETMIEIERKLFNQCIIVGIKPKERVIRTYCPLIITAQMIDKYINILKDILDNIVKCD